MESMGQKRKACRVWWQTLKEADSLEEQEVEMKTILKHI
jgi:hypothetical protein